MKGLLSHADVIRNMIERAKNKWKDVGFSIWVEGGGQYTIEKDAGDDSCEFIDDYVVIYKDTIIPYYKIFSITKYPW